jgi:two-component system, chemotaxis family, protein-glutamate methylesterase/glutaminase
MPLHRDLVVMGASGGGVAAVRAVVRQLPRNLPAAVVVVVHCWERGRNLLVELLAALGTLPAVEVTDGMPIRPGTVYLPPVDRHLLVERGIFRISHGPKENYVRPAIDPLFRSAARAYGPRVIGVILSGSLDDGAAGLLEIKRRGGATVVQDPADALYPGMPFNALQAAHPARRLPLSELPALLARLVRQPVALARVAEHSARAETLRRQVARLRTIIERI